MCKPYLHLRKSFLLLILSLSVALSGAGCRSTDVSTTDDRTPTNGLKDINGTQLYYQAMGKGQPIFFLHGRSGSHRYFLPHMQPLADMYQLLFYDQRGTGLSSGKVELKAISIDQFVEDLEALRVSLGFEKISLVAHSSGAIIALFYAFKYQDHVDKLILVDPVPMTNAFLVEQNQTIQQRIQRLSPQEQQTLGTVCRSSAQMSTEARKDCLKIDATLRFYDPAKALTMDDSIEENTEKNATTVQSLIMTNFTRRQAEIESQLKTLHVPTLIVHGDFDPIPIGASDYLHQRIAASQLVIMQKSGHFPFVEQPETFLAAIRAFMGS